MSANDASGLERFGYRQELVDGAWLAIGIAVHLGLKVRDARASRAAAGELPERNT
jgi:hypothetical protein